MKHSLLTLIAFATITGAQANQKGNGGDVFICPETNEAYLLDYYEGIERKLFLKSDTEFTQDRTKIKDPNGWSVDQWYEWFVDSIKTIDSERREIYLELARMFLPDIRQHSEKQEPEYFDGANIRFTKDDLSDINDSSETSTPLGCKKYQLAIQKAPQYREDKWLKIDTKHWSLLNNYQRALLVLHEVVLHEAMIVYGQEDSRNTRYMTSRIASWVICPVKEKAYVDLLRRVELPLIRDGIAVQLGEKSYTALDALGKEYTYTPVQITYNDYDRIEKIVAGYTNQRSVLEDGRRATNGAYNPPHFVYWNHRIGFSKSLSVLSTKLAESLKSELFIDVKTNHYYKTLPTPNQSIPTVVYTKVGYDKGKWDFPKTLYNAKEGK